MPNFSISNTPPKPDKPKIESRRKIEKKPHPRNRFVDASDLFSEELGSERYISKREYIEISFRKRSIDNVYVSDCGRFGIKPLGFKDETDRLRHYILLYFTKPRINIEDWQTILVHSDDSYLYYYEGKDERVILREMTSQMTILIVQEKNRRKAEVKTYVSVNKNIRSESVDFKSEDIPSSTEIEDVSSVEIENREETLPIKLQEQKADEGKPKEKFVIDLGF